MKEIKKELLLSKDEAEKINRILITKPESYEDCMGEDEIISHTVQFNDGIEMDIKICGVDYEEDGVNLPWTEAVLFKDGHELCCSEPGEEFLCEWALEYEDIRYVVEVKSER